MLFELGRNESIRFSELRRAIPDMSATVLSFALDALMGFGLVERTQYEEIGGKMEYGKERLVDLLLTIDEEAALALGAKGQRYPVIIVGGSALLLHDLTNRPTTHNVDVLSCHAALRGVLANYAAINGSVAAYADQVPYNFEDRLVKLDLPTKAIDFTTLSVEDLAVMKLYGWRPNDQQDLESPAMLDAIDWDELDRLVLDPDETQVSALSPRRYREMVDVYEGYARRHGHAPDA